MSKIKAGRFIPEGFVQVFADETGNAAYTRERLGRNWAIEVMVFHGKSTGQGARFLGKDWKAANEVVEEMRVFWKKEAELKAKKKAEVKLARSLLVNKYKVGDILYRSWGYDQTNIDYYQVVKVLPKSVVVRSISDRMVGNRDQFAMAGRSEPVADSFLKDATPVMKKLRPDGFVTGLADHVPGSSHYVSWYA